MDIKQKNLDSDPPSDEQLFRQAVAGAVPLKTPATTESKTPRPPARNRQAEDGQHNVDSNPGLDHTSHATTEPATSHRKNGVQLKVMQKLKRGHFPPGDQFDLHHLNLQSARNELFKFISSARQQGLGCVRIIHGKGLRSKDGPRLKLMSRQVLLEHPHVLAYTACKPADGGDGATDVLLKS